MAFKLKKQIQNQVLRHSQNRAAHCNTLAKQQHLHIMTEKHKQVAYAFLQGCFSFTSLTQKLLLTLWQGDVT